MRICISKLALNDLKLIYSQTLEKWGAGQAERYSEELWSAPSKSWPKHRNDGDSEMKFILAAEFVSPGDTPSFIESTKTASK